MTSKGVLFNIWGSFLRDFFIQKAQKYGRFALLQIFEPHVAHEGKIKAYLDKHNLDSVKVQHMGNEYKILKDSFTVHFDFDMLERPCTYPACKEEGFCEFKTQELRSRIVG